ncbi:Baeyer-Villiger monooxygenase ATR8 [Fusarium oxysporum f. sp. albedinis]|nr:Baeyer-Villiger monooxygenase ATR8 [Fusarium oxysporum f. sp. albedinis]
MMEIWLRLIGKEKKKEKKNQTPTDTTKLPLGRATSDACLSVCACVPQLGSGLKAVAVAHYIALFKHLQTAVERKRIRLPRKDGTKPVVRCCRLPIGLASTLFVLREEDEWMDDLFLPELSSKELETSHPIPSPPHHVSARCGGG